MRDDLPPASNTELEHLARLIADAHLRGIVAGSWTLARVILSAGYRLVPLREPRYGECRACANVIELNDAGALVDHDDPRRVLPCIGAHMVPLRMADAPKAVSADGR